MVTLCLKCGLATAVGVEMGYMGLPSLDATPRGRGKHRLAERFGSGGDADTDETFGCLYSGLQAVGLSTHPIEAYRDFLKAHGGRRHALRVWVEEHEDLPPGSRKPRYAWYKPPRRAAGFLRANVRFACSRCDEVFESSSAEWVRPFEPRDLSPEQLATFLARTVRPSEHNVHDAWPFQLLLFDELLDWLRAHRAHTLRIELVPERKVQASRGRLASAARVEAWVPPTIPREQDDRVLAPVSPGALLLLAQLHDREPQRREAAAQALADLAEPETLGYLVLPLDDPEECVRVAVVRALAALDDPRKLRLLGIALLDESDAVRQAARRGLAHAAVDPDAALQRARAPRGPLAHQQSGPTDSVVAPARAHRAAPINARDSRHERALLGALLRDYAPDVVQRAAERVGELRLVELVPELCGAARAATMDNADWCLRAVVQALARIGDTAGAAVLADAAEHRDSNISTEALSALAAMGGATARVAFRKALQSADEDRRVAAVHLLWEHVDCELVPDLVKALRDENWSVRRYAAAALAAAGTPSALRPLVDGAAAGDLAVAEAAHVALIQIGDPRTVAALSEAVLYAGLHDFATTATTFLLCGHAGLQAAGKAALARRKCSARKGVKPVVWGSRPCGGRS